MEKEPAECPDWERAWHALIALLMLPIILFPFAMLAVIILVEFVEPFLFRNGY